MKKQTQKNILKKIIEKNEIIVWISIWLMTSLVAMIIFFGPNKIKNEVHNSAAKQEKLSNIFLDNRTNQKDNNNKWEIYL